MTGKPVSVLIPFNTPSLYGMERAVIETFDLLRPEVEPHFLMSYTTQRLNLPVLAEIKRRNLAHSLFSDKMDWPRIGRPRSIRDVWGMTVAMIRGSRDVLKAARATDIIYIPSIPYFYFAVLAAIVHRLRGRRIVYHFHDLMSGPSLRLKLASPLITDYVHNTKFGHDKVTGLSPEVRKKRNHIIPNPINAIPWASDSGSAPELLDEKRSLLFVGQVALHKGVDLLLDAFQALAKSHHDLVLNIVGGCDDHLLRQRLENEVAGNSCEVKWWGYQDDVGEFFRCAYLYVHPSPPSRFHESFGLGVIQAMSVGLPSVCFRSGALQEILADRITGLICYEETHQCLAEKLSQFLDDLDFKESCGRAARQAYEEQYSNSRIKLLWMDVINLEQQRSVPRPNLQTNPISQSESDTVGGA